TNQRKANRWAKFFAMADSRCRQIQLVTRQVAGMSGQDGRVVLEHRAVCNGSPSQRTQELLHECIHQDAPVARAGD
ncbi:hypothetical protein, partial [Polyangium sp. 15x6]|uniref:hypothetical protein n=1 Tax=Polyangium sp. 15x6 TaxID=3042687 RepID=UPI00249B661D